MSTSFDPLHDGISFVRLIDIMGDDSSVTDAARISYGKGTRNLRRDEALIRYLMKHEHWSPFEMCMVKFHVKCPIFVARQWLRHKGNVNEYSMRYSEAPDEYYVPDYDVLGLQDDVNKQGTKYGISPVDTRHIRLWMENSGKEAKERYQDFINRGLSREQARLILPVFWYTEFFWQQNLRDALHFLRLRLDPHAQYEIRQYAEAIALIVKDKFPITWEAFENYVLDAQTFSGFELGILRQIVDAIDLSNFRPEEKVSDREWNEFLKKLDYE